MIKIENYGFRGKAFNLIKSYITNRNQFVQFSNEKANLTSVKYGVPQGSVLGPLLFLLYINDIANATPNLVILSYMLMTQIYLWLETQENVCMKKQMKF